jgi:hypothetical protein
MPKKPPLKLSIQKTELNKLDKFAREADAEVEIENPIKTPKPKAYPWESKKIKPDSMTGMGVPLTERHLLKLRFIAKHSRWSQRKFCRIKLEEAIDKEIRAMIKEIKPD